jgi:hypothetical protein
VEWSNKKILVPKSILQVRETSSCPHRGPQYDSTWELNRNLLGLMDLDAIREFSKFRKNSSLGNFLVKHANWQFFEILKNSSFGHNFSKSAKRPHQVIFPNLKNFLIHHFSNSTGNFAKSKNLLLWAICQNRKHVRIRKLFRI